MMNKYKVVFCETNASLLSNAVGFFKDDAEIDLIACANVREFEEKSKEIELNGLILDYDFPNAKEIFSAASSKEISVVMTARFDERFTEYEPKDGCVVFKPYSLAELRTKILKAILNHVIVVKLNGTKNVDERLSNIFIRAGIPPHIRGYQFLREAVKLSVAQPEMINSITKKLYPSIAQIYDTTPSKVERAIRHAIEVAWNRGKIENLNAIFGIKIYNKGDKPTNGELIALVADKILIESVM